MFSHSLLFLYYTAPLSSNHTVHATVTRPNYEWIQYRAGAEPEWQTNVKETENQDLQNYHQASVAVWSRRIDANKIWSPNCLFLWWSDNMITILPHALNKPIWHVCGNRQRCKNINPQPTPLIVMCVAITIIHSFNQPPCSIRQTSWKRRAHAFAWTWINTWQGERKCLK